MFSSLFGRKNKPAGETSTIETIEDSSVGDVFTISNLSISYEDDARSIYDKVINVALEQIEEFFPNLQNNSYMKNKQAYDVFSI